MRYQDRTEAGLRLAHRLAHLRGQDVVVLGLPRGGAPVAYEVARELGAALDVLVVRRLSVPRQPGLGFGAIGEAGVRVLDGDVVRRTGLGPDEQAAVERSERAELDRRTLRYRAGRAPVPVAGRAVVIVDDWLATGATAEAACRVARALHAARVVLAVPVGPESTVTRLRDAADQVIALQRPPRLGSVGAWYRDFARVGDAQVTALLERAAHAAPAAAPRLDPGAHGDVEVRVPAGHVRLAAQLVVPEAAPAVVAFAHSSGGSRHSPRNRYVAGVLNRAGLGTLLLDLLTADEEQNRHNVFDIRLLAQRLHAATLWLRHEKGLPVAYFGAGTGAAAALEAAAVPGADVVSIVSRGGRPDLATPAALAHVRAPTLLVVGSADPRVLSLNRLAADWMHCEHRIAVVPGATHLFPEPGTLSTVAEAARDWFTTHLPLPLPLPHAGTSLPGAQ
ncbi:phosphoribosyltransferase family protein [Streptomyces sp. NPDC020490]|uniref:phosphoribosyltransferase family protein n=1 Tax=Streptomyces sp. NPDC020490 TaxID=3365078 RepID=UPI0037A37E9E